MKTDGKIEIIGEVTGDYTIEKALESDIPQISNILKSSIGDYMYCQEEDVKDKLEHTLISRCNGLAVGMCTISSLSSEIEELGYSKDALEIYAIAVLKEHRRKGIAEKLIRQSTPLLSREYIIQAWGTEDRAHLKTALENNGFVLNQVIEGFWMQNCPKCVNRETCSKICSNYIYIR